MLLTRNDGELFFRLHRALMLFVNQRLKAISEKPSTPHEFGMLSPELRLKVRDAWLANIDLTDSFVAENPAHFAEDELDIVRSWNNRVSGKFYVFRYLQKYTVFLSSGEPAIAYGVLGLSQPIESLIGPYLPVLVNAVLLPFKDKIVIDGLMTYFRISFGSGIRRSLTEAYNKAKAKYGIVESLPMSDEQEAPAAIGPKAKRAPKARKPKVDAADTAKVIVAMTDQFCREHLNEEYAELCRRLTEKLARKRPSPLMSGKPETWACGIVRTIGWVNFLDDRSQNPHMKLTAIDRAFGVGESTAYQKAGLIRKKLKIRPLDPAWSLRSNLDKNPMAWMIKVNGVIVDARYLKREVQEEAFRQGLIPYIPERPKPLQEGGKGEDD